MKNKIKFIFIYLYIFIVALLQKLLIVKTNSANRGKNIQISDILFQYVRNFRAFKSTRSKMKLVQVSLIARNHSILRGFCLVSIYHDIERRICFHFFAALISNRFSQSERSYTNYHNFASNWNLSETRGLPISCVASVNLCFLHRLTFHFISPLNCMPRLSIYAHSYTSICANFMNT